MLEAAATLRDAIAYAVNEQENLSYHLSFKLRLIKFRIHTFIRSYETMVSVTDS
jgi:hypothetical protein